MKMLGEVVLTDEEAALFNGVLQDIKGMKADIAEIKQILKSGTTPKPDTPLPPARDLRRKLTLPVNSEGKREGKAMELSHAQLIGLKSIPDFAKEYYKPLPNGDLELFVPAKGALTSGDTDYPRTEERWYFPDLEAPPRPDGFDTMINIERGGYVWERRRKISLFNLPQTGKVVIRQSHAVEAPPDWKVVVTSSGLIYILCKLTDSSTKDDGRIDLAERENAIPRKGEGLETFELYTWFEGNTLKASLNGGPVKEQKFKKKSLWYPKGDGLYNAANTDVRAIIHAA